MMQCLYVSAALDIPGGFHCEKWGYSAFKEVGGVFVAPGNGSFQLTAVLLHCFFPIAGISHTVCLPVNNSHPSS